MEKEFIDANNPQQLKRTGLSDNMRIPQYRRQSSHATTGWLRRARIMSHQNETTGQGICKVEQLWGPQLCVPETKVGLKCP